MLIYYAEFNGTNFYLEIETFVIPCKVNVR